MLAIAYPSVLLSALLNDVSTPVAIISQLHAQPACAPVNASMAALRPATHDSGSGWFATPFLCDSFIHDSTPVYPGALRNLLESRIREVLANPVRPMTFPKPTASLRIALVSILSWRVRELGGSWLLFAPILWMVLHLAKRTR